VDLRPLGGTGLALTPVGLGTAPLGSSAGWRLWWGRQDKDEAIRTVHAAIDAGVNWIDTAPFYGWGRAEELVGKAVAGRRGAVLVFTKCGTLNDGSGGSVEDLRPETIRRETDASLRRLGIDRIDLLQFHDPDPAVPIEESWGAVGELVAEGKVRHGGLSNHPVALVGRALAVGPVAAVQCHYSLIDPTIEADVLPFCARHGIGVLAWSPLESGYLTDGFDLDALDAEDFRRRHANGQPPRYGRIRALVADLHRLAAEQRHTAADLALAFLLRRPELTGVIVGARSDREAAGMPGAAAWALDAALVAGVEQALAKAAFGVTPPAYPDWRRS